jgi:cytochrome c biogenesis protein CcmG/thiol:disulfide interchange protein DsbE
MTSRAEETGPSRGRSGFFLPLIITVSLGVLFLVALRSGDPSRLPSVLIGKPVPEFDLPAVEGIAQTGKTTPGFSSADLATGEVSIVNVWASWCGPCIQEHPLLVDLKEQHGLRLMGINYKDEPEAAQRFLTRLGNPFDALGADTSGRVAIDWGVYGVPETYVVDGKGEIVYKHVGPLTAEKIEGELLPVVAKVRDDARSNTVKTSAIR